MSTQHYPPPPSASPPPSHIASSSPPTPPTAAPQFAPPPTEPTAQPPSASASASLHTRSDSTPSAAAADPPKEGVLAGLLPSGSSKREMLANAASEMRNVFARPETATPASSVAHSMAPSAAAPAPAPTTAVTGAHSVFDDVGLFNGGSFRISHRDCNTILTIQLAAGAPLSAHPGAMIAMSHMVTLKGTASFSLKKYMAGGEIGHSTYFGPGEVLLAPAMLGDVVTLRLGGSETWSLARDAFLACTQGVKKDYKRQGLSKALFSGEGWFVYKISGTGLLWMTSFGAVIRKELRDGEKYLVDNGHLVAWNTKYVMERVASGGIISSLASGEGLVCKFTGPGTVYIQTRNARAFGAYMAGQSYQA
ncbi:hypothetical protein TD95_002738 [Thielaviopsis punctulata]|uniref:Altered inheritance of mitochondria protein 24, mitochondrial n=1 Tax=Thielaviopsis punctulata TaxID=72032 RepID=A0A0F4ZLZ8_9PEZI|nr:hypothetical protein TD95_002738 [Thielaviopsis punctulata]